MQKHTTLLAVVLWSIAVHITVIFSGMYGRVSVSGMYGRVSISGMYGRVIISGMHGG